MTMVDYKYLYVPNDRHQRLTGSVSGTLASTNTKYALRFQFPKTGTVTKAFFRVGTLTTAQQMQVTLQHLDSSGNPDGTALASGTITPSSGTSNNLVTFGSSYSATKGDVVALVFEWVSTQGSLTLTFFDDTYETSGFPNSIYYTTSWQGIVTGGAALGAAMAAGIIYDNSGADEYAHIHSIIPVNSLQGADEVAYSNTVDPYGLRFQLPFKARATGMYWVGKRNVGASYNIDLYAQSSPATPLLTSTIDADIHAASNNPMRVYKLFWASTQVLSANTGYCLMVAPQNTTTISIDMWNLLSGASTSEYDALDGGKEFYLVRRSSTPAFTTTTTSRPHMGIILDQVDDGAGSGGSETFTGGLLNRGMN